MTAKAATAHADTTDATAALLEAFDHPAALFACDATVCALNSAFQGLSAALHPTTMTRLLQRPASTQTERIVLGDRAFRPRISRLDRTDPPLTLLQLLPDTTADPLKADALDQLQLGFWSYDLRDRVLTVSGAWHEIRGVAGPATLTAADYTWAASVHPDDREALLEIFAPRPTDPGAPISVSFRHVHPTAGWVVITSRTVVTDWDDTGHPIRISGVDRLRSAAADRDPATRALANRLNLAIEVAGIGIWEFDETTTTVHWDDRMLEIYGVTDGNNIRAGDFWERQLHPDDRAAMVAYAEACRTGNHDFRHDYRIIHSSGEVRYMRSQARYVGTEETGRKLIGVNIDITDHERRAAELERTRQKLEFDARHDALTGLGNRRRLEEVCRDQLPAIAADSALTLFLLDLDRFKAVNDTLGHSAGDAVLCRVAKRLRGLFPLHAEIFRLGGDEFAVLCQDLPGHTTAEALCKKVITTLSQPFQLREGTCEIGTSIGYLHRTGPPPSITEFFSRADRALYAAKAAGRSTYRAAA